MSDNEETSGKEETNGKSSVESDSAAAENTNGDIDQENIIFQDERVVVSDHRLTCNHMTIPISEIHYVHTALRSTSMGAAFACIILSLVPLTWYEFKINGIPIAIVAMAVLMVASIGWLSVLYHGYVELWVRIGGQNVKIMHTSMGNRQYIYNIADAVAKELIRAKNLEERRQAMAAKKQNLNMSETMILRNLVNGK